MPEPAPEKNKPDMEEIADQLKSYINTTMDLYKLKATEKGAEIASIAIINVILGIFAAMILLFASLALAFCISEYFDKMYMGFLIVAGCYLALGFIILLIKDKWLKGTIVDSIIKVVYSN